MVSVFSKQSGSLRGILILLVAVLMFSVQDVIVKSMSSDYAALQIVVLRSTFALPIVLGIVHFSGGLSSLRTTQFGLHMLRCSMMFIAYVCFFLGLAALPYSLSLAIFFCNPLIITALSVPMLGEEVGWQRWGAVAVGFIGVVIIIQPGSTRFEPATLLMLAAAFAYAICIILTRRATDSAPVLAAYMNFVYLGSALIFGPLFAVLDYSGSHPSLQFLLRDWTPFLMRDVLLILMIACMWGVGVVLLSSAYTNTSPAILAPFEYFSIFYGLVFGFMIWREIPTPPMLLGMAIVVASGIFIVYRENQLAVKLP